MVLKVHILRNLLEAYIRLSSIALWLQHLAPKVLNKNEKKILECMEQIVREKKKKAPILKTS